MVIISTAIETVALPNSNNTVLLLNSVYVYDVCNIRGFEFYLKQLLLRLE